MAASDRAVKSRSRRARHHAPKQGPYTLVVIDDDTLAAEFYRETLADRNVEVLAAWDAQSGLELVGRARPQLVFLDLVMPDVHGMELLEKILAIDPGVDVFLTTAFYSTDSAVESIQKGAFDYLTKPIPVERLRDRVDKWLADAQQRQKASKLDAELVDAYQCQNLIGRSPGMLELFSRLQRIAPHFQTVLITGETGTGKELVAHALHRLSPRASGPYVVCNCAAIVDTLVESELFGYKKGAFTGALQDKIGYCEAADGGTLFLDEIGELPLAAQAKLLRVLQQHEIQPLGTPTVRKVDINVIAATNRDMREMASQGQVREDLYYRLAMVEIIVPRLADRKEDLPLLEHHFLKKFGARYGRPSIRLSRRAQAALARYQWPGNVRELENLLGACCMMATSDVIDLHDLPEALDGPVSAEWDNHSLLSLDAMTRQYAEHVVQQVGGNRLKAADVLGISRTTLYRLLSK